MTLLLIFFLKFVWAEYWIVVKGTELITKGKEEFTLYENESTYISNGVIPITWKTPV
jgi:hypothetical protein